MDKIWLKSYPPGIPATIDTSSYTSISHLFEQATSQFAAKPAFVNMGATITYAQLDAASRALAAHL